VKVHNVERRTEGLEKSVAEVVTQVAEVASRQQEMDEVRQTLKEASESMQAWKAAAEAEKQEKVKAEANMAVIMQMLQGKSRGELLHEGEGVQAKDMEPSRTEVASMPVVAPDDDLDMLIRRTHGTDVADKRLKDLEDMMNEDREEIAMLENRIRALRATGGEDVEERVTRAEKKVEEIRRNQKRRAEEWNEAKEKAGTKASKRTREEIGKDAREDGKDARKERREDGEETDEERMDGCEGALVAA